MGTRIMASTHACAGQDATACHSMRPGSTRSRRGSHAAAGFRRLPRGEHPAVQCGDVSARHCFRIKAQHVHAMAFRYGEQRQATGLALVLQQTT